MTPESQRIAIAEACGWTHKTETFDRGTTEIYYRFDFPAGVTVSELPDYLSDLNAMHEAEKVLTEEQQDQFTAALITVLRAHEQSVPLRRMVWIVASATAAQRAEAFLRTLSRWTS